MGLAMVKASSPFVTFCSLPLSSSLRTSVADPSNNDDQYWQTTRQTYVCRSLFCTMVVSH